MLQQGRFGHGQAADAHQACLTAPGGCDGDGLLGPTPCHAQLGHLHIPYALCLHRAFQRIIATRAWSTRTWLLPSTTPAGAAGAAALRCGRGRIAQATGLFA